MGYSSADLRIAIFDDPQKAAEHIAALNVRRTDERDEQYSHAMVPLVDLSKKIGFDGDFDAFRGETFGFSDAAGCDLTDTILDLVFIEERELRAEIKERKDAMEKERLEKERLEKEAFRTTCQAALLKREKDEYHRLKAKFEGGES